MNESKKRNLPEVVSNILSHYGAILESREDKRIEFVAPLEMTRLLNIPEHGYLKFSCLDSGTETLDASYDSNFFSTLAQLFGQKGRLAIAEYPPYQPDISKIDKKLQQFLPLANAIFQQDKTEIVDLCYLLVYFKYEILSDERQEGIIPILVNQFNLSISNLEKTRDDIIEKLLPSQGVSPAFENTEKAILSSCTNASVVVRKYLKEFVQSQERRLNRDIKRVYEYYTTMTQEIQTTMEKKVGGDIKKYQEKLEAINTEQQWKVQDLLAKYMVKFQIYPLSIIFIKTRSVAFWVKLKRRTETRKFPLTYNPILKQFDPLPCESCFTPHESYYLCDEHLHILCSECFKKCPDCEKQYCKACYPKECPKCKRKIPGALA